MLLFCTFNNNDLENHKEAPMRISLAQMTITQDMEENERKTLAFCDEARDSDLLFFPEVQYAPFFPQYEYFDAEPYVLTPDSDQVKRLCAKAREHHLYLSPNLYLQLDDGKRYDSSLWISPEGELVDIATMVHIFNAKNFYEANYYAPSRDGFKVFETPHGRIGIVICFDRHFPESVRTCAAMGADLVIIPTVNLTEEPMELFGQEIRVLSMQNRVFIAMCNRVGREGSIEFAGQSLVTHPSGDLIAKADAQAGLLSVDLDLSESGKWKSRYPFLDMRRPEMYR